MTPPTTNPLETPQFVAAIETLSQWPVNQTLRFDLDQTQITLIDFYQEIAQAEKLSKIAEKQREFETGFYQRVKAQQGFMQALLRWSDLHARHEIARAEVSERFMARVARRMRDSLRKISKKLQNTPHTPDKFSKGQFSAFAELVGGLMNGVWKIELTKSIQGLRRCRWNYWVGTGIQKILHQAGIVLIGFCLCTLLYGYATKQLSELFKWLTENNWAGWAALAFAFAMWALKKYVVQPPLDKKLEAWRKKILLRSSLELLMAEKTLRVYEAQADVMWASVWDRSSANEEDWSI